MDKKEAQNFEVFGGFLGKRAQVAIFIIVGILIVAAVVLFFALKSSTEKVTEEIPVSLQQPYNSFLQCLENDLETGVKILESQGGYIYLPDFEPGSTDSPFSSHLLFSGISIPYWYYISGNGIEKENVPTKEEMQSQIERFLENKVKKCDLSDYMAQGYSIEEGDVSADVTIQDGKVLVEVDMDFSIDKGSDSALIKRHKREFDSRLGELYDSALAVYDKEQSDLFLENYAVDILRLYAPVDGVELTCSPLIWSADEVFDDIEEALEVNTIEINPKKDKEDYFFLDVDIKNNVRFLNSRNWSSTLSVDPSEGLLMRADPVGNQAGLGILGFCYAPYHFVYSIKYPVLVQVYDGNEIFQFPLAVVIDGNNPRKPLESTAVATEIPDFCKYKNVKTFISVKGIAGEGIEGFVSYECSGSSCFIGKTENGKLDAYLPQCVNGKISVSAEGYETIKQTYSSINDGSVEVVMERKYPLQVSLSLDSREYLGEALVTFTSDKYSNSVYYPGQNVIELIPGEYNVSVTTYSNTTITFEASVKEQCVEVPKSGIGGIIGLKEKKCYNIEIPSQVVSKAISGGGKTRVYLLDSTLRRAGRVEIDGESLQVPTNLEQLQTNYYLYESKKLEVDFV